MAKELVFSIGGNLYGSAPVKLERKKLYGWSKFIIVVPSIAIREGVYKSFETTQEHFAEEFPDVDEDKNLEETTEAYEAMKKWLFGLKVEDMKDKTYEYDKLVEMLKETVAAKREVASMSALFANDDNTHKK